MSTWQVVGRRRLQLAICNGHHVPLIHQPVCRIRLQNAPCGSAIPLQVLASLNVIFGIEARETHVVELLSIPDGDVTRVTAGRQ